MIRTACLLIALCVFSMMASAQDDPLARFPLQVSSHWVYEDEWKSGDRKQPIVDRWTSEETITGWVTIPEGVVVLREVKEHGIPTEHARTYLVTRDREPYLVHGNCVYVVDSGGWDSQRQQLRPEYRKYLIEGIVSPDFCFPLRIGEEWGNVKADTPWRVEPARDNVGSFLRPEYAGAIHVFTDHFGGGGLMDVWFQQGVGVVGEHYIHSGTYDEFTKRLVSRARPEGLPFRCEWVHPFESGRYHGRRARKVHGQKKSAATWALFPIFRVPIFRVDTYTASLVVNQVSGCISDRSIYRTLIALDNLKFSPHSFAT